MLLLVWRIRKWASHPKLIYVSKLSGKFNWKGNIKAILRASPDQELAVKKLRKKVIFTDGMPQIVKYKDSCILIYLCLFSCRFWRHTTLSLVRAILKQKRTCSHFSTRRSTTIQNFVSRKNEFDFWNRYFHLIHLTQMYVVHRLCNATVLIELLQHDALNNFVL